MDWLKIGYEYGYKFGYEDGAFDKIFRNPLPKPSKNSSAVGSYVPDILDDNNQICPKCVEQWRNGWNNGWKDGYVEGYKNGYIINPNNLIELSVNNVDLNTFNRTHIWAPEISSRISGYLSGFEYGKNFGLIATSGTLFDTWSKTYIDLQVPTPAGYHGDAAKVELEDWAQYFSMGFRDGYGIGYLIKKKDEKFTIPHFSSKSSEEEKKQQESTNNLNNGSSNTLWWILGITGGVVISVGTGYYIWRIKND